MKDSIKIIKPSLLVGTRDKSEIKTVQYVDDIIILILFNIFISYIRKVCSYRTCDPCRPHIPLNTPYNARVIRATSKSRKQRSRDRGSSAGRALVR